MSDPLIDGPEVPDNPDTLDDNDHVAVPTPVSMVIAMSAAITDTKMKQRTDHGQPPPITGISF